MMPLIGVMKALNARQPKPLVYCSVDNFLVQPVTTVVTPPNLPPHQPTRNCASRYNDPPEMPIRCPRRALVQSEHLDVVRYEADGYHRDPLAQSTRDTGFPLEEGAATVVDKVLTSSPICDHCDIFAAPRGDPYSRLRSSHHRGGPYSFQT
jgi:hypothetical protein